MAVPYPIEPMLAVQRHARRAPVRRVARAGEIPAEARREERR
ncbi:hypothetical protein [Microbispora bryophytorum]